MEISHRQQPPVGPGHSRRPATAGWRPVPSSQWAISAGAALRIVGVTFLEHLWRRLLKAEPGV
jgi:hypothetical protein